MRRDADFSISILLPVYFGETSAEQLRLLRRALASIYDQEFPGEFEILVIDDGSPLPVEGCRSNLGGAGLEGVRWIRCEQNGGLVQALNRGLVEARHPFIARLDADDQWLQTKIVKQVELFAADPDLSLTATGMTLVTPEDRDLDVHIRPGDWNGILRFFIEIGCPFPHGSVIARRDIYRLLGGYPHDPGLAHCEDYALWGVWLRFFKPAMVEEALYRYTISASSVSALNADQQQAASRVVQARFRDVDPIDRLPRALADLAGVIGGTLVEAGTLAFRMWRHGLALALPRSALGPLRTIMPDRQIIEVPPHYRWRILPIDSVLLRPRSGGGETVPTIGFTARPL